MDFKYRLYSKSRKEFDFRYCVNVHCSGQIYENNFNVTDYYEKFLFTGRRDKNNHQIFEGDIVRVTSGGGNAIGIVKWDENFCSFDFGLPFQPYLCEFEVIGNIKTTPELIQEVK